MNTSNNAAMQLLSKQASKKGGRQLQQSRNGLNMAKIEQMRA